MITFQYTITDPLGIHARPAGLLAKEAKQYASKIMLDKEGKKADAAKLLTLMGLGCKCGDIITVTVEGEDEEKAAEAIKTFFSTNL